MAAALLAVGSLLPSVVGDAAGADDRARREAAQLTRASEAIERASATVDRLRARPASAVAIDRLRQDLELDDARFALREALRAEQDEVYAVASDPELAAAALPLVTGPHSAGLSSAVDGLQAVWRLAGITDPVRMRPRHNRRFADSEPVDALLGYYRGSAAATGIDWTYLAAINFVESDFGRLNGPSSAGALGPMQFLPATFREYGNGGDIMSARDSIQAAALLLARNGAPSDYDRALLRYNRSRDYVRAVESYAAALRADPLWLTRLYYWSTFG